MLNLWRKIQEKGHISPKRKEVVITTLDPRYDGPLRGFEPSLNDIIPLEKCHLNLDFDDLYHNKIGYNYFKHFLETKMNMDVLSLWSSIRENTSYRSDGCEEQKDNNSICHASESYKTSTHSPVISEKLLKLPDEVRNRITSITSKSTDDFTDADVDILAPILREILLDWWNEFVRSEWYCRYQVDLLTSRSVTLGDILCHETAMSYFMQFLEIEGCHHAFEFWFAAMCFEKHVRNSISSGNYNEERSNALNEAISIYEKYLSLQATCPLGFGDDIRCAVEVAICDEEQGPHPDCFKPAVDVVLAFLRQRFLIPFFSSQHYVHLLSDMIRNSTLITNHSPTSSVSDYSVESKQPLLHKLDPDSIWKRRKQSGLSFGRIDQLGRYRRDIEPDPGRNNGSTISRIMKKWVQRNENRVEEEMAWQVAEMVVKDIIDLTMGCNNDNDGAEENCCASEISK